MWTMIYETQRQVICWRVYRWRYSAISQELTDLAYWLKYFRRRIEVIIINEKTKKRPESVLRSRMKKNPFASDLKNSLIEFHKYVHSVKSSYRSLENKLQCFDILSKTKQPSFKFIYILYRCSWYSVWFLALLMLIRNERRDDIYDFQCSVLLFRFGVVAFELISFS